jgi:hypothetical protein
MLFHVVLLLELRESEQDPILKCIPTLTAISSRDLDSVLKTVVKAEGFERVVRPPHFAEALMTLLSGRLRTESRDTGPLLSVAAYMTVPTHPRFCYLAGRRRCACEVYCVYKTVKSI